MNVFKNSQWIKEFEYLYASSDQIPAYIFNEIKARRGKVQSENSLISMVISAWNKEVDKLKTVDSLSKNKTGIPFD